MDLPESELHRVEPAYVIKETRAGGVLIDCDGEEIWFAQDMIDDKSEVWKTGDEGCLLIEKKVARKKGLL